MHTGKVSNRFRARIGAGGIPTPLGSDMSRAKFDFSGYDPNQHKKKREPSPERKVIVKVEDDMEIFTTDFINPEGAVEVEIRNEQSACDNKEKVEENLFGLRDNTPERLVEINVLKKAIDD